MRRRRRQLVTWAGQGRGPDVWGEPDPQDTGEGGWGTKVDPSRLGTEAKRPLDWDGRKIRVECSEHCPKPGDISAAWSTPALPSAWNGLSIPVEWRRLGPPGSEVEDPSYLPPPPAF